MESIDKRVKRQKQEVKSETGIEPKPFHILTCSVLFGLSSAAEDSLVALFFLDEGQKN